MQDLITEKAAKLPPEFRAAAERLLGRALDDDEEITLMAFPRHEAARRLDQYSRKMTERVSDISDQELEDTLDEAMRHVRPGYERIG